ncbi:Hcp family type VI secretion system effector [Pseudomonas sp. NPDC096917]|uniref:Hcp family type VI secretion system effector n=1 Tax=Pseudomonas sp. NPDC096917 TaxID=3364483 RepID=UPI00383A9D31
MSTPAYIKIEGKTQGLITQGAFTADSVGNVFVEGHEDEILVQAIKHSIKTPTDPQSGQPAGPRVHSPFIFTCSMNKAIPLLNVALATGETLTNVLVEWYRTSTDGKQEKFYRTLLEDATIVSIDTTLPHAQDPSSASYTQIVEVSMTYRKIIWEHTIAGTEGSDDWRKPV